MKKNIMIVLVIVFLSGCTEKEILIENQDLSSSDSDILPTETSPELDVKFLGTSMDATKQEIYREIGESNIVQVDMKNSIEDIFELGKWGEIIRGNFISIETIGNHILSNAFSTSIAFENQKIKEYSVWWMYEDEKDMNTQYNYIKRYATDDYGELYEENSPENDIIKFSTRDIGNGYRVNIIARMIGNDSYLLKFSCIKNSNTTETLFGGKIQDDDVSYNIPEGWIAQNQNYSHYKTLFGPRNNDFSPNINIRKGQEEKINNLEELINMVEEIMIDNNIKLIEKNPKAFITDAGLQVGNVKYVLENVLVYQYYIFLDGVFIEVTCGELFQNDGSLEYIFENFVKKVNYAK